jgi:Type I restriction enzyme R protein N terminus (HSDR_N)
MTHLLYYQWFTP